MKSGDINVSMPDNSMLMEETIKWSENKPDYLKHRAYAHKIESSTIFQKVSALVYFFRKLPLLLFKRVIQYERISYDLRNPKSLNHFLGLIWRLITNILRLDSQSVSPNNETAISRSLEKYGCCVVTLSHDDFGLITDAATQEFNQLAQKRESKITDAAREFDDSRATSTTGSELYKVINQVWSDMGIIDAVSTHLNKSSRLVDVNPQINDNSDTFWANIFPDINLKELPLAAYFHRDASGGDLKAILYMTDVSDRNGPFSYVLGSHKMQTSKIDDLIMEANDNNGLSSTGPIERTLFSALPSKLRQKGSFGNDLSDKDFFTQSIQESTWSICAPKGSLIIFDTKGIHRGGMVIASERRVITTVIG